MFLEQCRKICKKHPRKVYFADGSDIRVIQSARILADEKLALPVILGCPSKIRALAEEHKIPTPRIRILHPMHIPGLQSVIKQYWKDNRQHGVTFDQAEQYMSHPLISGATAAAISDGDICLIGNRSAAVAAIKTALRKTGNTIKDRLISGSALIYNRELNQLMIFADIAVIPRPDAVQLADIAVTTAENFHRLTGIEPLVALLSFSTAGSAEHEMIEKIREAKKLIKALDPELKVEGETQFDAAFVPEIGLKKNPVSTLKQAANVFIFPSLNAGNIALHIARHLAGCRTFGQFLQGGMNHVHHLPLSSTVEDIVDTAVIGLSMRQKRRQ